MGLNGWIPVGGQVDPTSSSVVGDGLVWKNAQKNETKNKISETMNRIIPHCRPFVTIFVCNPWNIPSWVTSRHHWIIVNTVMIAPVPSRLPDDGHRPKHVGATFMCILMYILNFSKFNKKCICWWVNCVVLSWICILIGPVQRLLQWKRNWY
jgi:hypothetical protein